jgi:spermidine synthase
VPSVRQRVFFAFFLCSGFCGLLYEVVWTRLALARFGVTTTIVSVVLSVFMLGLALGSWASGSHRLLRWLRTGRRFLRAYALVEVAIGSGAFAVPYLFDRGRELLLRTGQTDSGIYHLVSGLLLGGALLPWATLLGATFALAMGALRVFDEAGYGRRKAGFSYLYVANVLGAALGSVVTAVALIELFGFRGTLFIAAAVNASVGLAAWLVSRAPEAAEDVPLAAPTLSLYVGEDSRRGAADPLEGRGALAVLFATGFVSMAMELIWTRLFSYHLGTFVYAFAAILAVYLVSTFLGSQAYRRTVARGGTGRPEVVCAILGGLSILPLLFADPRLVPSALADGFIKAPWAALGIAPLCAALGYLTPLLVDRWGAGHPGYAARAYGVNVLGCVLGPLAAGYLLLPALGERPALVALAGALLAVGLWVVLGARRRIPGPALARRFAGSLAAVVVLGALCNTYAEAVPRPALVRRDTTATVVAYGTGMEKRLLVNGVGITRLTTVTKVMAHLPLALADRPRRALVICFGMGTTTRALASWGIEVTAVELVPSVPPMFDFFFPDREAVLGSGRVRVEVDDGRRFLDRVRASYDVITLDPPPPIAAAGSSLLYSREFYQAVKRRLVPGGLLQQWIWTDDPATLAAAARALEDEFPHVVAFASPLSLGTHFIASAAPISVPSAAALTARLPAAARADLVEWLPGQTPESILAGLLARRRTPEEIIAACPAMPALTDDRPANEYFLLRMLFGARCQTGTVSGLGTR